MAFSLTTDQVTALNTELTNLTNTLTGYDSTDFIAAVNSGVMQAEEVDDAFQRVIVSFDTSVDGAAPREVEVLQLNGTTIRDPLFGSLTMSDYTELENMGNITPVVDSIIAAPATSVTSSANIRANINRFYPNADAQTVAGITAAVASTSAVYPGHTFFALEEGSENNTNGESTTHIPLLLTFMITLTEGSETFTFGVNDFEQFILLFADTFLPGSHPNGTISPGSPTGSSNSNATLRGTNVGGTASISITTTGSGTSTPQVPGTVSVGSTYNLGGIPVSVIQINSDSVPTPSMGDMSATRTTTFEYFYLQEGTIPTGTFSVTNGSGSDTTGLRTAVTALKRFPALNTQTLIRDRVDEVLAELGVRDAGGIYNLRYQTVNSRANWNDGSLALLQSKISGRLNLFNPQTLADMNIIDPLTGMVVNPGTYINEYVRTANKIAFITQVLALAT